jgi:hypothetical protein
VYELIATRLQAYFPHAKVSFEGSSILYENGIFYRIRYQVNEPFTENLLNIIRNIAREHNFGLLDFIAYCENGNLAIDFWIIPLNTKNNNGGGNK